MSMNKHRSLGYDLFRDNSIMPLRNDKRSSSCLMIWLHLWEQFTLFKCRQGDAIGHPLQFGNVNWRCALYLPTKHGANVNGRSIETVYDLINQPLQHQENQVLSNTALYVRVIRAFEQREGVKTSYVCSIHFWIDHSSWAGGALPHALNDGWFVLFINHFRYIPRLCEDDPVKSEALFHIGNCGTIR